MPQPSSEYDRIPAPRVQPQYGPGPAIKVENPPVTTNSTSASSSTAAENTGGSTTNKLPEKSKDYDVIPSEVQAPVETPKYRYLQ